MLNMLMVVILKTLEVRELALKRYKLESDENRFDAADIIPAIPVFPERAIKVVPLFMEAMVRFIIKRGSSSVSVYLDLYSRLCGSLRKNDNWKHREIHPGVPPVSPDRSASLI